MARADSTTTQRSAGQHLVWNLDQFHQFERCAQFVRHFRESLCVYSPNVKQIYGNYDVVMPTKDLKRLIILPNPYAYHDIFNDIPEEAISSTGIHIIPGDMLKKRGIFMTIPYKDANGNRRQKAMPLAHGVKMIAQRKGSREALLPVISKDALKELDQTFPSLHLKRIDLNKIPGMSPFARQVLGDMIEEKLESCLRLASQPAV